MCGKTSKVARTKTLNEFKQDKSIKILISTFGVGGVGLNLTAASRVLVMEPWWNVAMENQAFCRVYRMGQTKETELVRLVVKETVDERIIDKQEIKSRSINKIMEKEIMKGQDCSLLPIHETYTYPRLG
jgi:SNF2 family DNA or RNA helicase